MGEDGKTPTKGGMELIIYQIGELKALFTGFSSKQDAFQEKIDKRVSALEIWQAGEVEKDKAKSVDVTKIILGAFSLVSAALAVIAGLSAGWIKPI